MTVPARVRRRDDAGRLRGRRHRRPTWAQWAHADPSPPPGSPGLPVPWTDVALAVVLAVAGVVWVLRVQRPASGDAADAAGRWSDPIHAGRRGRASHDDRPRRDDRTDVGRGDRWSTSIAALAAGGPPPAAVHRVDHRARRRARAPRRPGVARLHRDHRSRPTPSWRTAGPSGRPLALLFVGAVIAASEFSSAIPPMPGWLSPFAILAPVGLAAATIRSARARADASARRAVALEHETGRGHPRRDRRGTRAHRPRTARRRQPPRQRHGDPGRRGRQGHRHPARPGRRGAARRSRPAAGRRWASCGTCSAWSPRSTTGCIRSPASADLDALVGSVRAAGQPVTLAARGRRRAARAST